MKGESIPSTAAREAREARSLCIDVNFDPRALLNGINDWNKKSVRAGLLLVPRSEAFALPDMVERTNLQKPHAEYVYIYTDSRRSRVRSRK